jgi:hypothetical protein
VRQQGDLLTEPYSKYAQGNQEEGSSRKMQGNDKNSDLHGGTVP